MQEIWEGEYTYKCILTKDFKSDIREIVVLYPPWRKGKNL